MDAVCAAVQTLHQPNGQHKEAQDWLLRFRTSSEAWSFCVLALGREKENLPPDVQLFAAQTLRHKLNTQGRTLDEPQLQQLREQLLALMAPPPTAPNIAAAASSPLGAGAVAALLSQLCLALCSVALLLTSWNDVVETAWHRLCSSNAVLFLELLAEEAASDMRHMCAPTPPGGGSAHVDWAASARGRVRAWAPAVCSALVSQLLPSSGQALGNGGGVAAAAPSSASSSSAAAAAAASAAQVGALGCLAAWVKLGALHELSLEAAQQLVLAVLTALQSASPEVMEAALGVMLEAPEYAPDALLCALRPPLASVAAAARGAALAGQQARASAWARAFGAFAAAQVPEVLRRSVAGAALREQLLQLTCLPHLHEGHPLALPALEVWALAEEAAGNARGTGDATTADDGESGAFQPWSELAGTCEALQAGLTACWLTWRQAPAGAGEDPTEDPDTAAPLLGAFRDALRFAARGMGAQAFLAAAVRLAGGGGGGGGAAAAIEAAAAGAAGGGGRVGSGEGDSLAQGWRLQLAADAAAVRASSPPTLRLHAALIMAAAAGGEAQLLSRLDGGQGSAGGGGGGGLPRHGAASPSAAEWGAAAAHAAGRRAQEADLCSLSVAQLLRHSADLLQQLASAGVLGPSDARPAADAGGLLCAVCDALLVWAAPVLRASGSATDERRAALGALLRVVLTAAGHPAAAAVAARAARVLLQAALELRLGPLHQLVPSLMDALRAADTTAAEQDLLLAISAALSAHWQEQEVWQTRMDTIQHLLEPPYRLLTHITAQLHSGQPWAALAPWADPQLSHQLTRVRVLLGAMCPAPETEVAGVDAPPPPTAMAAGARTPRGATAAAADGGGGGDARMRGAGQADSAGDRESSGSPPPLPPGAPSALRRAAGGGVGRRQCGPVVRLLMEELWPQLQAVCSAGASGRFLHSLAKACSALLATAAPVSGGAERGGGGAPAVVQSVAMLCALCFARPGGASLAEPLGQAVELASGAGFGLAGAPGSVVFQALTEVWACPEVLALREPGAGGDRRPDLAEHFLKLSTAYVRHGLPPQMHPSGGPAALVEGSLLTAAACAGCCHRKVAASALALMSAAVGAGLGAGGDGGGGGAAAAVAAVVMRCGLAVVHGLLAALIAPSSLPRVHRVVSVLLDLASLEQERLPGALKVWLSTAAAALPPGSAAAARAQPLAAEWVALLAQPPAHGRHGASRSYLVARRLKRLVRDFAEMAQKPA